MKKITYLFFFSLTLLFSNRLTCMEIVPIDRKQPPIPVNQFKILVNKGQQLIMLGQTLNPQNYDQELLKYSIESRAIEQFINLKFHGKEIVPEDMKVDIYIDPESKCFLIREVLQEIYDRKKEKKETGGLADALGKELMRIKNEEQIIIDELEQKYENEPEYKAWLRCSNIPIGTIAAGIGFYGILWNAFYLTCYFCK